MESPKKTLKETIEKELSYNPVLKRTVIIGLVKKGIDLESMIDPNFLPIPEQGLEAINALPEPDRVKHQMLSPLELQLYLNLRQKYFVNYEGAFLKASVPIVELKKKEKMSIDDEWDLRKSFVTPGLRNEFIQKMVLFQHAKRTENINDWAKYRAQKQKCKSLYEYAELLDRCGTSMNWL